MDYVINGIIVVAVGWFILQPFLPAKGVVQITTEQLKPLLREKGYHFIDVRTPHEFQTGKIKQFKNIPLAELKQRTNELDKNKTVVLLCQSGMRSNRAAKLLKKAGFPHVTNVRGGFMMYVKEGLNGGSR